MSEAFVILRYGVDLANDVSKSRVSKYLLDHARSLGVDKPVLLEFGGTALPADRDGNHLLVAERLQDLPQGSHLVFRSLRSLSTDPWVILEGCKFWLGLGCHVHVLGLGRVSANTDLIGALVELVGDIQQECDKALADAETAYELGLEEASEGYKNQVTGLFTSGQFKVTLEPAEDDTGIGDYLATRRRHVGMSQAELATELGLTQSQISQHEAGRSQKHLAKLVSFLDPGLSNPADMDAVQARARQIADEEIQRVLDDAAARRRQLAAD